MKNVELRVTSKNIVASSPGAKTDPESGKPYIPQTAPDYENLAEAVKALSEAVCLKLVNQQNQTNIANKIRAQFAPAPASAKKALMSEIEILKKQLAALQAASVSQVANALKK